MLTRLPSVSKNETYWPMLGISIGSASTSPPASMTCLIAARMSSTAITSEGCCAGQSAFFRKKATIDRTWLRRTVLVRFGCRSKDIVTHILAHHLRLPAECVLVELRNAISVFVG